MHGEVGVAALQEDVATQDHVLPATGNNDVGVVFKRGDGASN